MSRGMAHEENQQVKPERKTKHLRLVFEVEVITPLDEADVPQLLEKYREEGRANMVTAELLDLTDSELQQRLYGR